MLTSPANFSRCRRAAPIRLCRSMAMTGAALVAIISTPLMAGEPAPAWQSATTSPAPLTRLAVCGDSEPDAGEQCDDGNLNDGDGCSSTCTVETGFSCTASEASADENAVGDGGLELGGVNGAGNNPFWSESGDFLPPICSPETCGANVARTGTHYGWFGGVLDTQGLANSTLTQTATIPATATQLSFYTRRLSCASPLTDNIEVRIDQNLVATVLCDTTDAGYQLNTVDLVAAAGGPYNDNATHDINFVATTQGLGGPPNDFTNMFLDDVQMLTGNVLPPVPSVCTEPCFSEDFDEQGAGDLSGWTVFNVGTNAVDWGTTDDGICGAGLLTPDNYTGGSGEAACVDSDQAGPGGIEAYLCSPQIDVSASTGTQVQALANYQIFPAGEGSDALQILVGTQAPAPGTIASYTSVFSTDRNVGTFQGAGAAISAAMPAQNGYVCIAYQADFDWYAQVDDFTVAATDCGAIVDDDNDGIDDQSDNCLALANPDQLDTDADGYGNLCDGDFDDNCMIDFGDLAIMKAEFFGPGETDMDGNGSTDFVDLSLLKAVFFGTPGPSAQSNLCDG